MSYFVKAEALQTEGDVEIKLLSPLLLNPLGLAYFSEDVKSKSYMAPTEIDKGAGKKIGYYPDFTILLNCLPVMIIEAKEPTESVEKGFREAQLYAHEVNKRWAAGFNPIELCISSTGLQLMYGAWDSSDAVTLDLKDLVPGSAAFEEFRTRCGRSRLLERAKSLRSRLLPRGRFKPLEMLGGAAIRDRTLGANQFARELAPIFREYFDTSLGRTDATILDKAYVSTREITHYDSILESLLRDNLSRHIDPDFEVIETSKKAATALDSGIRTALAQASTTSPMIVLIGGVGSGKSIFIDKYIQNLIDPTIRRRTLWVIIDFNTAPSELNDLDACITEAALKDLPTRNGIHDFKDYDNLLKYFGIDIKDLRLGQFKKMAEKTPDKFDEIIADRLDKWIEDKPHFLKNVIHHYGSDRRVSVVVVFDNADRRDASQQLKVFQAVQHFRAEHKCFCLLSLSGASQDLYGNSCHSFC